jgi:hypothetical protein
MTWFQYKNNEKNIMDALKTVWFIFTNLVHENTITYGK